MFSLTSLEERQFSLEMVCLELQWLVVISHCGFSSMKIGKRRKLVNFLSCNLLSVVGVLLAVCSICEFTFFIFFYNYCKPSFLNIIFAMILFFKYVWLSAFLVNVYPIG